MNFRVGQKVVLVDDGNNRWAELTKDGCSFPRKGEIYHVRAIVCEIFDDTHCLLLREIVNEPVWLNFDGEPGFRASRFRPLVDRKTSIEIFERMLGPKEKEKILETIGSEQGSRPA